MHEDNDGCSTYQGIGGRIEKRFEILKQTDITRDERTHYEGETGWATQRIVVCFSSF